MSNLAQFIRAETIPLTRSSLAGKSKGGSGRSRRRWNAQNIRNEAERRPEAIPHIDRPEPPIMVFGVTPSQVVERIKVEVANRKVLLRKAAAEGGKVRRIRKDQRTLISGVVGYPVDWQTIRKQPEEAAKLAAWKKDVVGFLVEHHAKAGGELVSVVEHVDEPYPHLHFYVLPVASPTFAAREIHDGGRLKLEARAAGLSKREEDAAYIRGTVILQDAFYFAVSQKYGHARHKEKRPRVARNIFVSEKARLERENRLLADSRLASDKKLDELARKATELNDLRAELDGAWTELRARQAVLANRQVEVEHREAVTQKKERDLALATENARANAREAIEARNQAAGAEAAFRQATKQILPRTEAALAGIKASILAMAKIRDQIRQPQSHAEARAFSIARATVEALEQSALAIDTFLCVNAPTIEADPEEPEAIGVNRAEPTKPDWEGI
jgi:hypothetical protein